MHQPRRPGDVNRAPPGPARGTQPASPDGARTDDIGIRSGLPGFVILPRRRVVERSLAWVMHACRHARDYERLIQHAESRIAWAAITLMSRRITRRSSRRNGQAASREADRD
ncbi:hypothetical protein GCM10014715_82390 [Streptomyces spiralis]|uniref:Transposase n=1 Tax=Streptomyces spiralis TaxID=66376 RepID=A0A919E5K6_9ACTN|nr:hypothetical protein GCM10014715_82390 [Streptomyces spiralis]